MSGTVFLFYHKIYFYHKFQYYIENTNKKLKKKIDK